MPHRASSTERLTCSNLSLISPGAHLPSPHTCKREPLDTSSRGRAFSMATSSKAIWHNSREAEPLPLPRPLPAGHQRVLGSSLKVLRTASVSSMSPGGRAIPSMSATGRRAMGVARVVMGVLRTSLLSRISSNRTLKCGRTTSVYVWGWERMGSACTCMCVGVCVCVSGMCVCGVCVSDNVCCMFVHAEC